MSVSRTVSEIFNVK